MIKYVIFFCYKCTTAPDTNNYKHAVQTRYLLILSRIRRITTFVHMIETKLGLVLGLGLGLGLG